MQLNRGKNMNNLLIIKFVDNIFLFYILFIIFDDLYFYYVPIDNLENLNLVTKFENVKNKI